MAKSTHKGQETQKERNDRRAVLHAARVAAGLCRLCGKREIEEDHWHDQRVNTCAICRAESQSTWKKRPNDFCVDCQAVGFHRDDCPVGGYRAALAKALDRHNDDMLQVECPSPASASGDLEREHHSVERAHQPAAVEVGRSFDEGLPESGPAEIDFPHT